MSLGFPLLPLTSFYLILTPLIIRILPHSGWSSTRTCSSRDLGSGSMDTGFMAAWMMDAGSIGGRDKGSSQRAPFRLAGRLVRGLLRQCGTGSDGKRGLAVRRGP